MSVILLVIGIVVTGAGLGALGFGIPISEFSLGTTLITAGTTGLCGGLILIGLSAAVAELRRVGDLLKARPVGVPTRKAEASAAAAHAPPPSAPAVPAGISPAAHPPALPPFSPAPAPASYAAPNLPAGAPMGGAPAAVRHAPPPPPPPQRSRPEIPAHDLRRAEPHPAPASAMDASAVALERLRSSVPRPERARPEPAMVPEAEEVPLSPNGHQPAPARRASLEPALEPRLTPADRLGGAEAPKSSRLDFLFRARQSAQPRTENFDTGRSAEPPYGRTAPPEMQPRYPEATRAPAPPPPVQQPPMPHSATVDTRPHEPAAASEQPATGILKSGVVDGMAYTLYSDGSIEAKLPDGTVRFGSIAELRAHIEKNP